MQMHYYYGIIGVLRTDYITTLQESSRGYYGVNEPSFVKNATRAMTAMIDFFLY